MSDPAGSKANAPITSDAFARALAILSERGPLSGLADCHLPGVCDEVGEFVVMPHNHRQDLRVYLLCGAAINWRAIISSDGAVHDDDHLIMPVYEHEFHSALAGAGQFRLDFRGMRVLRSFREPITREGVQLAWSDVHTVVAPPRSAWLVEEGPLAPPDYVSLCYSIKPHPRLDATKLYRPMAPDELVHIASEVLSLTKRGLA